MLKKGPLFSVAILFLVLIIGCSPPDTGENKASSDQPSPSNKRPVACAGSDRAVLMMDASSVTLDGSRSFDPDGDILNYLWTSVDDDDTVGTDHDGWSSDPQLTVNLPGTAWELLFCFDSR